jgi:hypothetical protein
VDEHDADAVIEWLRLLLEKLEVELVFMDDLVVYGVAIGGGSRDQM